MRDDVIDYLNDSMGTLQNGDGLSQSQYDKLVNDIAPPTQEDGVMETKSYQQILCFLKPKSAAPASPFIPSTYIDFHRNKYRLRVGPLQTYAGSYKTREDVSSCSDI